MTAKKTLIVSKNKDTIEVIQKGLTQVGLSVGDCAADIVKELPFAMHNAYDIVFADEEMFSANPQTVLSEFVGMFPDGKVVILIAQGNRAVIRSALAAGAADYIAKPLDLLDVVQSIRRISALSTRVSSVKNALVEKEEQPQRRIIAVYSGRNGSGKTTLAVNLAIALADLGGRVCIIDADFQFGDVCRYFGATPESTIADLIRDTKKIGNLAGFLIAPLPNLDILAAPLQLEQSDRIASQAFQNVIRELQPRYSYIVIDTPAGFSDISLTAVDAADIVLLTAVLESVSAVKNLRACLDTLRNLGYTEEKIKLVLNRKGAKSPIGIQEVEKLIRQKFIAAVPNDYLLTSTAIADAKPLLYGQPTHEIAWAIRALAASFAINEAPIQTQASIVQRLGSIFGKRSS